MNEDVKKKIESAMNEVTEEHLGGFEIFNSFHVDEVAQKAGVCPGMVYDYLGKVLGLGAM